MRVTQCTETDKSKGGYQSGQMGQTVNLLAMPSVVRIHHHPLSKSRQAEIAQLIEH